VEKAIWYIESHFARDITLDELAGICDLSRFQMSRLFSEATGMTVDGVRPRSTTHGSRPCDGQWRARHPPGRAARRLRFS